MDGGLLWNALYCAVAELATQWNPPAPRRGHPDDYRLDQIVVVWLWAAFANQPLANAVNDLQTPRFRRGMQVLGYRLPTAVPHETTLRRRTRRLDFQIFLMALDRRLRCRLHPHAQRLLIDSTLLPVPTISHDLDATWGHHGQRGYRWHTLVSVDRVILQSQVEGANIHELAVAPRLVERAAAEALRPQLVIGDLGYDSEPLHRLVHQRLQARLITPINDRGGRRLMLRTPYRAALNACWNTPAIKQAWRQRPEIERMYATLKGSQIGLFALPPWVRGLDAVRRWIMLKQLLYHTHLLIRRRAAAHAA